MSVAATRARPVIFAIIMFRSLGSFFVGLGCALMFIQLFDALQEPADLENISLERRQTTDEVGKPNIPPYELDALLDLYNSTSGKNWTWKNYDGVPWIFNATSSPCAQHWQGIVCTSVALDGFLNVMGIDLYQRNMHGFLPITIGNFSLLKGMDFAENALTGTLPETIGRLSDLQLLNVGTNQLNGSLPDSFSEMTKLAVLYLNENKFTGTLPELIGTLQHMSSLLLNSNNFNGTIPESYCSLTAMQVLNLGDNYLQGTIPEDIGQLAGLTTLALNSNFFVGTIPESVVNMVGLNYIYLDFNGFYGTIPTFLGNLTNIMYLSMNENYFTGTIPHSLTRLEILQNIYLHTNRLTGTIPAGFGDLEVLTLVDFHHNKLTGTIPPDFGYAELLEVFDLYANFLTGTVPASLSMLSKVQNLDFSQNYFTGTLSPHFGLLTACINFKIDETHLTGSIPASIGDMTSLSFLSLHDNHLTSTLPHSISQMERLNSFFVFNNLFTGSISGFINATMQRSLQIIEVSGNRLTGQLPGELFKLPQLQTLAVVSNCFEGSIPTAACNSTTIQTLALDGLSAGASCQAKLFRGVLNAYVLKGKMSGQVPPCLFEIPTLNTLHLSGNDLTGTLPENVNVSVNLVDISISHNRLTGTVPKVFLKRIYYNLDLSYNKFAGTLTEAFATVPGNLTVLDYLGLEVVNTDPVEYFNPRAALSLRNNRLSHVIPPVVQDMLNVSVLQGNMFGCYLDKSDLPRHDRGRETYQCGSNSFNIPYYVLVALVVGLIVMLLGDVIWRKENGAKSLQWVITLNKWISSENLPYEAPSIGRYQYLSLLLDKLSKMSFAFTLYIVVVLAPMYAIVSVYYGTHTYEYAWAVSGTFLSGEIPFAILLICYALLNALLVWLFYLLRERMCRIKHTLTAMRLISVAAGTGSNSVAHVLIYAAYVLINLSVVIGVNLAYVWTALYASSTYFVGCQIAMSIFKIVWNNLFARQLTRWSNRNLAYSEAMFGRAEGFFAIQLSVAAFNFVVVPCIVVAAISPDCFADMAVTSPAISSYFYYEQCALYSALFGCLASILRVASTSYHPPFTYSYQCSASIITYYAPAYVYLGLFVTFGSPLVDLFLQHLHSTASRNTQWYAWLHRHVPVLLQAVTVESAAEQSVYSAYKPYFDANHLLVTVVSYLGVMLTFGVLFPPLAFVMLLCICSTVWVAKLKVGRFLHAAAKLKIHAYISTIDSECRGVGTIANLRQCMWQLTSMSSFFYTLFLFDILGDAVGFDGAYWVLIVVPLLPLFAYLCSKALPHGRRGATAEPGVEIGKLEAGNEGNGNGDSGAEQRRVEGQGCELISEEFNALQQA